MFKSITRTWNCFVGCDFGCTYCSARRLAETRLRNSERYKDGFKPHLVESELNRKFKPREFIFVAYMGDIAFASGPDRKAILTRIRQFKKTKFLIQSKDPRFFDTVDWPDWNNIYYGTTIETNRDYQLSKAPEPWDRYSDMAALEHPHKFISIEPICDFDLFVLLDWMRDIEPEIIEVGADNYHNNLPEPDAWKLNHLLNELRRTCHQVIEKDGLKRLKDGV